MGEKAYRELKPPDFVFPPGETLREILEDRRMSQAMLAQRMGRPKQKINEIIQGQRELTSQTALELERVLTVPASFWSNLERNFRDHLERQREKEALNEHLSWLKTFPYTEMVKHGCVDDVRDKIERLRSLLNFFGVASPKQWEATYGDAAIAYRRNVKVSTKPEKVGRLSAWLRQCEVLGERRDCAEYDASKFREALSTIRSLAGETSAPKSQRELESLCAQAGVAVVSVREYPSMGVNGATRWIRGGTRPLIMLTLRYRYADILWFTFFHEACHILRHRKKLFLEDNVDSDDEREANKFAADSLISPTQFKRLAQHSHYSEAFIRSFAKDAGITPGTVVGRLQHERLLPKTHLHSLRVKLQWASCVFR